MTVSDLLGRVMATDECISTFHYRTSSSIESENGKLTIESSFLPQETYFSIRVAANQTDNDGLLLTSLKTIDTSRFNAGKQFLERG